MKRFTLFLLFTLSLHALVIAQTAAPHAQKDSATKRAVHQLRMLEKQLHLNEDQVLQLQVILINRDVAMDSISHNPSGDRRTDNHARRFIQQDADQKINAILTDDQKSLYQQWKASRRRKASPQNPSEQPR